LNPPLFFLLVDAIPFELAREAWAAGELPGFREPRPLVSVFPSLTEVAVPAMLRSVFDERPDGYEARYYHPPSGEVRGRPGDDASAMAPYRARPRGLLGEAAIYLLRARLAYAQIRWITHRFQQEGGPWLGYLSATDGVAHFSGREALGRSWAEIAGAVHAARVEHERRHGVLPGVVLCSDHGMAFGRLEHLDAKELSEHLTRAGFEVTGHGRDAVVLAPCGDVGAGVVHAPEALAPEVAAAVAGAPGVDLVFARVEAGCLVFGAGPKPPRARIDWREDCYRYVAEEGDPLGYAGLWQELAAAGKLADGFAADRDVFALSWAHRYPDALARARLAFDGLVRFPAAVLFSMSEGWTFGPGWTHAGTRLIGGQTGTHGALLSEQSLGFASVAAEGDDPWSGAPALRPEQVFAPWRELIRTGREPAR
jgi:hypothetical protein